MKRLALLSLMIMWCHPAYAVVLFGDNGNNYDFIQTGSTWHDAKTGAEGMSYLGTMGHLATITSHAENEFLKANFGTGLSSQFAWIGGHEPNDDGIWRWAVGPEAGIQFSNFATPTAPFNYANWDGVHTFKDQMHHSG